jgi:hypothetical protein
MRRLTIRGRLTFAYAALFGLSTAVLMGVSYWLLGRNFDRTLSPADASDALAEVGTQYAIAFVGTVILAAVAGWIVAGRALAPLGRITRTAREVTGERLGERISLDGPPDELRELAGSFDAMLDRLEASFDGQRRFIANAGHELRSPLSVIRSEAEVALANPETDPAELRRTAEVVVEATERTERLLDGLLTLARSQRGLVRRDTVDVAGAAEVAASLVESEARGAGIVVRVDAGRASAIGDRGLLERLVANLVENAVRHNRRGGHVALATGTAGPHAVVTVENTGRLLAPEEVARLTEPFERLERGAPVPGAGLGLSIVASVVEAHNGRLELEALPAGGLSARVVLPGAIRNVRVALPRPAQDSRARRTNAPAAR